ncbi:MAG: agmatinase [Verrucomicrobiales bacterium]
MTPEFTAPNAALFIGADSEIHPQAPAIFGVPYDGTTSFRPGTRNGPDALRQVSDGLETYSPELDRDLEDQPFADLGNLCVPHGAPEPVAQLAAAATREILAKNAIPVMLGGEHSITPGPVHATLERHPELAVVQLDAHADLRADFNGSPWSHASAMRRCLDQLPAERLLQVGIRSGTRAEFQEMRAAGRLIAPEASQLASALAKLGSRPLYLTLDLDIFDPALLPGTGTPEAGGIDWPTFSALLATIPWSRVVACDIMELSPALDPSGCSSCLAAKAVREILLSLQKA